MSHKREEWYLEERPRALAIVLLTERDDLEITASGEQCIRFLVKLDKTGSRSPRQFGVALDARVKPTSPAGLKRLLSSRFRDQAEGRPYPFPVCLFYFTMQDNGAYYAWIAEPRVTEEGQPSLLARSEAGCSVLDRAALDRIVDSVERWYAARDADKAASVG
jgi:hypothetical protein